ncbi:MAG: DNA polymerase, partial [Firmicutes bacterium]|nr:DNA polymerase [Bacillota bacterium]
MEKKLLLIDGNSLINRAFYAFGANGTQFSHKGKPTGATYGFLNMLFKGIEDLKPTHIAVAFDVRAKTFRHNLFTEYKAGRRTTPDDLISQIADLKELLDIMGVSIIEKQGFEADDIIGTLSQESDMPVIILTADRDAFQLISDNNVKGQSVELHLTKTGVTSLDIWTNNRVILEKEIIPSQFIDIKSLQGDTSDNIPGAKGIGEKTALQLVQQFSSIDNLYNSIDKVTSATTRQKLVDSKEMVYKSYQLAKIITDVPLDINFDGFKFTMPLGGETYTAFNERGFKSLIKRSNLWGDIKHAPTNSERKENIPTQINEVKTIQDLITAVNLIITSKDCIGISIEYNDEFFSLSQKNSVNEYHQYKIHVLKNLIDGGLDYEEIIQTLKPFFQCDIPKFVVDSKELKKLLATRKIELNNVKIDAKICAYLLGCEPNLTIYFSQKLREREMFDLYQNIELPLVDILLEMERNGAKLSNDALTRVSDELTQEINDISEQIYSQAGERFNINSPKILSDILYKKLGLDTLQKTKTGFSTNEEVLQKLKNKHQIVPLILRYRKIFKLNSTYVNGYKNLMDEQGFIHTTFNNTVTVTGRLSSSEPNLQNIPARSEEAKRIRQLFTSRFTKDNNKGFLLCADYSQI